LSDRPRDARTVLRLAAVAALTLAPLAAGLLPTPGLATAHLQLALLAAVLAGALLSGLWAGLVAATLGFALMLWRAVEPPAAGSDQGWTLDAEATVNAFLWFALAKLAAALVAMLKNRVARLSEARGRAEAEARRGELLLAELSHRVMNDMQTLVGVFHAQASQAADPEATDALRAAAGRVRVLGRMHERLSAQGREGPAASDGAVADSRLFIEGLVADLRAGLGGLRPVGLAVAAEARLLPLATLGNIGLVVNELVTNALKHAFPGGREGLVRVVFRCDGAACELVVADNGVGMAAAAARAWGEAARPPGRTRGGGQGERLLRALAAQLGGRLEVVAGEVGGTLCRLRFPTPRPETAGRATAPADASVVLEEERAIAEVRGFDGAPGRAARAASTSAG
jgi:two-component sensor histidine kinase